MNAGQTPSLASPSAAADRDEILKARARALARPLGGKQTAGEAFDVVEFRLAQERYAVERAAIREVYPLRDLTPLPCTPPFIPGIINVRGQILPLLDMKKFFDMPDVGITDLHQVIIVRGGDIELGIVADAVVGVRSLPFDSVQRPLPTLTGIRAQYSKGVTNEAVVILDIARILSDPRLIVEQEVES